MFKSLISSRKWVVGVLYVLGVILCDAFKRPLDPATVMWTAMVVLVLIGGQHVQETIAARISGQVPKP